MTETPSDTAFVPSELAHFLTTRSPAYLYLAPGTSLPASRMIPGDPKLWRGLAKQLEGDAPAAHEALNWLSAQPQPTAYVAVAAFWGELIRLGILPADGGGAPQLTIAALPLLPSRETLSALANLEVIPDVMLQDFQRRVVSGEVAHTDLVVAALHAPDSASAATVLALGGVNAPWDTVFSERREASVGQQVAVDVAADQADHRVIDRLLARTDPGDADKALFMASHWARRQLSGERLAYLEQRVRDGAFVGAGHRLLATLLANAEDRDAAQVLAGRLGIGLPSVSP